MQQFVNRASRLGSSVKTMKRTYASEASKSAGEEFPAETFGTSAWRNTAIVVALGAVWYNVDESISNAGNKNVITKWIENLMTPSDENDKINEGYLNNSNKLAEYRLIYQEAQRPPIYRMRYPESFDRASPRALTAGNQADLSDLKIRND
ncbi:unnamed protein product [Cunninghamella echinulata]